MANTKTRDDGDTRVARETRQEAQFVPGQEAARGPDAVDDPSNKRLVELTQKKNRSPQEDALRLALAARDQAEREQREGRDGDEALKAKVEATRRDVEEAEAALRTAEEEAKARDGR